MVRKRGKELLFLSAVILFVLAASANAGSPTVVNFDDLYVDPDYGTTLSGTNYAGLTWEFGSDVGGNAGEWEIPPEGFDIYPHSGPYSIINGWGASLMGITFPTTVDVSGAYFAGAIMEDLWTSSVRVHGYLSGAEVSVTDWFTDIDTTPDWFAINLSGVDRIVAESIPIPRQSYPAISWYSMDDLTYTVVPEPGTIMLLGLGGMFLRRRRSRNAPRKP
jgi:hypothetical protein